MRAVQVLGLADDGREVVCEDPTTGEQFLLARDEKLRAAARGDLARFTALRIDSDPGIGPREIQFRIRTGASVAEVAALAGTSLRRIERFAYPVLLERITMAERARRARPTIDGIAGDSPLEEIVTANLAGRGHDGPLDWDAFRDEDDWVLRLTWAVGRSENRAHWTFHPGPVGGTLTTRDENAADIVDPALQVGRPLREVARPAPTPASTAPIVAAVPSTPVSPPAVSSASSNAVSSASANAVSTAVSTTPTGPPGQPAGSGQPTLLESTDTDTAEVEVEVESAVRARTGTDDATSRPHPQPRDRSPLPQPRPAARGKSRSAHPTMPSWEDVLLGTRSGQP